MPNRVTLPSVNRQYTLSELNNKAAEQVGQRHKLLVIDDDPKFSDKVRSELCGSFEVLTASSGIDGLMLANEIIPALIILEIIISGICGITVCMKLRSSQVTANIPIIIITAAEDDDRRAAALMAGADDLVSKPFRSREVSIRISNLIQNSRKEGESHIKRQTLSCGNLILDFTKFEASLNNKKIVLTVLEFNLLRVLIENKETILSREDLLNSVWPGKQVCGRVVDNHIHSLRKKLMAFDHQMVSIYGGGYGIKRIEPNYQTLL